MDGRYVAAALSVCEVVLMDAIKKKKKKKEREEYSISGVSIHFNLNL